MIIYFIPADLIADHDNTQLRKISTHQDQDHPRLMKAAEWLEKRKDFCVEIDDELEKYITWCVHNTGQILPWKLQEYLELSYLQQPRPADDPPPNKKAPEGGE